MHQGYITENYTENSEGKAALELCFNPAVSGPAQTKNIKRWISTLACCSLPSLFETGGNLS